MKFWRLKQSAGLALLMISVIFIPSSMAGPLSMTATAVITTSTTETVTNDLDFGSIDLDPVGDTITIAAAGGAATPVATAASVITGGSSGLITIVSQVIMNVKVTYPAVNVILTSGADTLTIAFATIAANSQYPSTGAGVDTVGGGTPLLINVGGIIVIPAAQANGTYTGTINLTVNYT